MTSCTPNPPRIPDVVLTVEEAASALRIGRTSMYALIRDGEIKTVKIGNLRRVPVDALSAYVTSLYTPDLQREETTT